MLTERCRFGRTDIVTAQHIFEHKSHLGDHLISEGVVNSAGFINSERINGRLNLYSDSQTAIKVLLSQGSRSMVGQDSHR